MITGDGWNAILSCDVCGRVGLRAATVAPIPPAEGPPGPGDLRELIAQWAAYGDPWLAVAGVDVCGTCRAIIPRCASLCACVPAAPALEVILAETWTCTCGLINLAGAPTCASCKEAAGARLLRVQARRTTS